MYKGNKASWERQSLASVKKIYHWLNTLQEGTQWFRGDKLYTRRAIDPFSLAFTLYAFLIFVFNLIFM